MPGSLSGEFERTIKRGGASGVSHPSALAVDDQTRDAVPALASQPDPATRPPSDGGSAAESDPIATPLPIQSLLPVIPGYALTGEIARGGMGVVFTARDKVLNREVAVKTLLPGSAPNPVAIRRFVNEARITARLSHPGIPPVYALGTLLDDRPFLAMKLIRGRTLAAVLSARASRPAAPGEELEMTALHAPGLLQVFEQICQAVGYAHAQGVIHRDLKPANVMIGAFGEVQVMDWGLARDLRRAAGSATHAPLTPEEEEEARVFGASDTAVHAVDDTAESRIGEALGTPSFMPPEQARGEWDRVGPAADVFALGGILCAILTGQPPYTGTNILDVLRRAVAADLGETYARLDACGADPDLVRLAKQCLAPRPEDRLPDGAALVAAIQAHHFRTEERLRAVAAERARAKVRQAEARAMAAIARAREEAEERVKAAARRAEERRVQATQRHWAVTALVVLAVLLSAYLFLWVRDGRAADSGSGGKAITATALPQASGATPPDRKSAK